MKAKDLAGNLHGREYGQELTEEEEQKAKDSGLVVVFGYSDDCVEFRGAVNEETYLTEIHMTHQGILENHCDSDDDCPNFKLPEHYKTVTANFGAQDEYGWYMEIDDVEYFPFDILEFHGDDDVDKYCRGIVFNLNSLEV